MNSAAKKKIYILYYYSKLVERVKVAPIVRILLDASYSYLKLYLVRTCPISNPDLVIFLSNILDTYFDNS
jgi:hypothetical protein